MIPVAPWLDSRNFRSFVFVVAGLHGTSAQFVSKVECVHAAELESDERKIVQRYVARKLKEAELGATIRTNCALPSGTRLWAIAQDGDGG